MKLKIRLRVGSRFGSALARNRELAKDKSFWDANHGIARRAHPLELFECVGYHNYFIQ